MVEVDLRTQRVIAHARAQPRERQPPGRQAVAGRRTLYVADQINGGLWEINPMTFRVIGFLRTGAGAHGLYPSRDARVMYVSNREAGTISVVSFRTRRVIKTWQLPLPAQPGHGRRVSRRHARCGSAAATTPSSTRSTPQSGRLRATIPVGGGPHGLCVWPQPGRYSLGHTGILR